MKLTGSQINSFNHDGFIEYGPLLTEAEVRELRTRIEDLFLNIELGNPRSGSQVRELRMDEFGGYDGSILQILNVSEYDSYFFKWMKDCRLLDIAESLLGSNIRAWDEVLYKPAREGGEVSWHQDNEYFGLDPDYSITCWIPLTDVDGDNGSLRFIPGSHKQGIRRHTPGFQGTIMTELEGISERDAITLDLPAGGLSVHHVMTAHASQPNQSARPRPVYAVRYASTECRSTKGDDKQRVIEARTIVRGTA